tara:strand:+ start:298 stop:921 length:624 start_codon:yes stop_codon:yes gene_type:complete
MLPISHGIIGGIVAGGSGGIVGGNFPLAGGDEEGQIGQLPQLVHPILPNNNGLPFFEDNEISMVVIPQGTQIANITGGTLASAELRLGADLGRGFNMGIAKNIPDCLNFQPGIADFIVFGNNLELFQHAALGGNGTCEDLSIGNQANMNITSLLSSSGVSQKNIAWFWCGEGPSNYPAGAQITFTAQIILADSNSNTATVTKTWTGR